MTILLLTLNQWLNLIMILQIGCFALFLFKLTFRINELKASR